MSSNPRLRVVSPRPVKPDASYVLVWLTANRRLQHNPTLDRAAEVARALGCGVLVYEGLRVDYPWACDRFHRFIIDGMRDNAAHAQRAGITYYAHIETQPRGDQGLLAALATKAACIITDDYPCFFHPRMLEAAARSIPIRIEAVSSHTLVPPAATPKPFTTASSFRWFWQKHMVEWLRDAPTQNPTLPPTQVPAEVASRWPQNLDVDLATLPLDHTIGTGIVEGGPEQAKRCMTQFLRNDLARYHIARNDLSNGAASGLSPYLHFGHLSPHQVFQTLAAQEDWSPDRVAPKANGKRTDWWGMCPGAEAFLDELITWRELGTMYAHHRPGDYHQLTGLPDWARATLTDHAKDERPVVYDLRTLDNAKTHDALWNAAQTQLKREGRMHNYLRMLWGKKVLEWTEDPRVAAQTLISLNNKYALDGRDPNSYSGIFWVFGRFDRAWGPERPIFGKVRYMSSDSTQRKLKVDAYIRQYS